MSEERIGREIRMLNNLIKREAYASEAIRESHRVTGVHGWMLGYLYDNRERVIFQRDVEAEFRIRRSTATEILKRMERNGLITREAVDYDARLKRIRLTPQAERIHLRVAAEMDGLERRLREGLSEAELTAFFAVTAKLRQNLEARGGQEKGQEEL